jgi:ATP-dependent helicase/DNAse subunit B
MTEKSEDAGVIAVLVQRFEGERLPRALDLKEKVDQGETLNDIDIAFLEQVLEDANKLGPLLERHDEYHKLVAQATSLYKEITDKALENEKRT